MSTVREWVRAGGWTQALIVAVLASVAYTAVVLAYSVHPDSGVSISGTLWHAAVLGAIGAFGTIGVPVALWLRYRLRAPAVLSALVLFVWHVALPFSLIGTGEGDSPAFLFVFAFAPGYVLAYAILAGGEWWFRSPRSVDTD